MSETLWQTIIPRPLRHTPGSGSFKVPATVQLYCEQDDVRTTALAAFESMARLARTSEEETGLPAWQITPDRDNADVTLRMVGGDPTISRVFLTTKATVPDLDDDTFQQHAEAAKEGCPVSKALAGVEIDLDASLA
mgnify:CR=1 FL=1